MKERLQKLLSAEGICSRRAAEQMIREGRVWLNGRPAQLGESADLTRDDVRVDGRLISKKKPPRKYYLAFNKPRGYVTTLQDRHAKKTVADLFEDFPARVFPVGRLDKDSEGLLFFTNDGAFSNRITHPSSGIRKLYRVSVKPAATEEQLAKLAAGILLDGTLTTPGFVRVTGEDRDKTVIELALHEGKNRVIRRMCEAVGLTVSRLKRTAIGPVSLGSLPSGQYRELTKEEVRALLFAMKGD